MKMYDINNNLVNVDVRESSYPIRNRHPSEFQAKVYEKIREKYPNEIVLEEYNVCGSKLRIDFFLPRLGIAIEASPEHHVKHTKFFHGDRNSGKFAGQIRRDITKEKFIEINGFKLIVIEDEKDLGKI